jgi:hypothetical protein
LSDADYVRFCTDRRPPARYLRLMTVSSSDRTFIPWTYAPGVRAAGAASPVSVPDEFPAAHPSTGTPDDDDEPEDEHDGENEASERETDEETEAPEEFLKDDEDRVDD